MISVCIATFNGERFIHGQLASILTQIGRDDEVIISDDSSSDNTLEIIASFKDVRIKVFAGQNFKSPIYNFENAIKHASGDFIFLADQDDVWIDNKVIQTLKALQSSDLIVSNAEIVNENLSLIMSSFYEWRHSGKGIMKNLFMNSYLGCCMAFKRAILDKALPFPKNIPMHDAWLGIIGEIYFKVDFIDETLVRYRRHNSNATSLTSDFKSKESLSKKFEFRMNLSIAVIKRVIKLSIKP